MTVRELITELNERDPDALVYVPSSPASDSGPVQFVVRFQHVNIPVKGVSISDDIVLFPGDMADFVYGPDEVGC